jgi:hypothetical protein
VVGLRNQLRRHRRLVDVQCEAARLFRLGRVALVVEERDDVIGVPSGIVLPGKAHPVAQGEVVLLASQPPDDPAGHRVQFVDCPRVARRDEQLAVSRCVDRVDVNRVEGGG